PADPMRQHARRLCIAQLGLFYSRASPQWYTIGRAAPRKTVAGGRTCHASEVRTLDGVRSVWPSAHIAASSRRVTRRPVNFAATRSPRRGMISPQRILSLRRRLESTVRTARQKPARRKTADLAE